MAQQNTTTFDTVVSNKPSMVTDLNPSYISKEQYSYARNVVYNTTMGDLGTLSNEMSNTPFITLKYKVTGVITLPDDQIMIFSTDGVNSEIGIS